MKNKFISRVKNFILTTILGGFAAILPIALILIIFQWLFKLIYRNLAPIANWFKPSTDLQRLLVTTLIALSIIFLFFLAGLLIRSRIGRFFKYTFEKIYLSKIPGYNVARETVRQFFGKNQSFFSEVVLVDIFNSGTLMTGFITDKHNDYYTVFVPTGPNPTSGNICHVKKEKVFHTTTNTQNGMKTIISCGAGSSEIFANRIDQKNDALQ